MKTNKLFAALLMGLAVVACQPKEKAAEGEENAPAAAGQVKTAKDFTPSRATVDSVSYLVGIQYGQFLKNYDFGELNWNQIKKGMDDFVKAKGNPGDPDFVKQFKVNPEDMNRLFNDYLENRQNRKMLANKEAGDKFLAANKKKEGVLETESGLQYKILDPGSDVKPTNDQDTVWVRYKGTLLDGTVFDEVTPDKDSIRFVLGRVIKGWTEGMKLIGEGGKVKLFIPSDLAYGERAPREIGPNQTLVFDVDLLKVLPYAEPAAEE